MAQLLAAFVALALATRAYGHGEQAKPVPRLSPETLAAIGQASVSTASIAPTSQTAATCFEGFTLYSDGSCVKDINEPAIPRTGEVTLPYLTTCPAGYELAGPGQCVHTSRADPSFFCRAGFTDDGPYCTLQSGSVVPTRTCENGELVGSRCINRVTAPYIITPECPEGSQVEEDGGCWKIVETFDCTPAAHTGKNGRAITGSHAGGSLPLGQHVRVEKAHQPMLRNTIREPASAPIPRSTAPGQGLSTSPLGLPRPTGPRPGHYELLANDSKGKRSIHRNLAGKKYARQGKDGECGAAALVGPASPGPAPMNPVPAVPVLLPEPIAESVAPAEGFGNAAILEAGEQGLDECTKDLVAVSAPQAFKVGVASQSCAKKTQVDAIALVSCPPEYYDDGSACVREFTTEADLSCPDGFGLVDGLCTGPAQREPKIQKCADGTTPINGQCLIVDTLPGSKVCGPGFTDVGTGCRGVVTTGGPAFECRDGLTLVGDRCIGQSIRPAVAITMTADAATCSK